VASEQEKSSNRPPAERYYTEYVDVSTDKAAANEPLRKAMGEKRQRGWSLVSLNVNQSDGVVELVWDTSGFRIRG
jgi:hypothetical protein